MDVGLLKEEIINNILLYRNTEGFYNSCLMEQYESDNYKLLD